MRSDTRLEVAPVRGWVEAAQAFRATTTRPGTGTPASLRVEAVVERQQRQGRRASSDGADMVGAVGVAQLFAEDDAVAVVGLDREGEQAAVLQHLCAGVQRRPCRSAK